MPAALPQVIHYIYGAHRTGRQHHVDTTGHGRAENLERCGRYKSENNGKTGITHTSRPEISAHKHSGSRHSRRKTGYEFADNSAVEHFGEYCNQPGKKWRFERYVGAIVHRQDPVAGLENAQGHDGLARFSF